MTKERKFAILFAAMLLAARKLIDLDPYNPNMAKGFFVDRAIDDAVFILEKIDERWPTIVNTFGNRAKDPRGRTCAVLRSRFRAVLRNRRYVYLRTYRNHRGRAMQRRGHSGPLVSHGEIDSTARMTVRSALYYFFSIRGGERRP